MRDILVKTYFRDDIFLLLPFYRFYKDVWDPKHFIFYIGCSKISMSEMIERIEKSFQMKLVFKSNSVELKPYICSTSIYQQNDITFIIYNTDDHASQNKWDNTIRPFLLNINHVSIPTKFRYFITTDNDDFFYSKDPDEVLKTKKIFRAHTLEMIPQKEFSLENKLLFISHSYFYRTKGAKNEELDITNSHNYCRNLHLLERNKNEYHSGKNSESCCQFDSKRTIIRFDELDNVCFAFGCIDLNYLINSKNWIQSKKNNIEMHNYSIDDIINEFNTNYTLTQKEMERNIIFDCSDLKRYFTL